MRNSAFYMEAFGVLCPKASKNIYWFMHELSNAGVEGKKVWVKNSISRVYFDFCSQNSLDPIKGASRFFYDAAEDDIFMNYWGEKISCIKALNFPNSMFSGSKTRDSVKNFIGDFYGEKEIRG